MDAVSVVMAGFGGQGLLLAGKILAHAALAAGREVSWLPSYGPEMRGGTANVTVCIARRPIGSPLAGRPDALVAMNRPSLEKFLPRVRPGGVVVVDVSMVPGAAARDDCVFVPVDARDLAQRSGAPRAANLVVLGAFVGATGVVALADVERAVADEFTGEKARFVPGNLSALRAGAEAGRSAAVAGGSR